MFLEFKQSNNQDGFHNDESIKYFSDLAFNSNEDILLDIIINALQINNFENRKSCLFEIKDYYFNKGVVFNSNEFDENLENFLNMNIGNVKGAFLELLMYKLINVYCRYDKLYKECYVIKNNIINNHPYDIIVINNVVNFIDIKFSCRRLKKIHLDYLTEYVEENNVKSYLVSLDTMFGINNKLQFIKVEEDLSEEDFHEILNNIALISINEIYDLILNKKCLVNAY